MFGYIRKSTTFALTEPATLPEDQRTRAGRFFLYNEQQNGTGGNSKKNRVSVEKWRAGLSIL